jgi:hypothetical protein
MALASMGAAREGYGYAGDNLLPAIDLPYNSL